MILDCNKTSVGGASNRKNFKHISFFNAYNSLQIYLIYWKSRKIHAKIEFRSDYKEINKIVKRGLNYIYT